jgi:hypothetical protein
MTLALLASLLAVSDKPRLGGLQMIETVHTNPRGGLESARSRAVYTRPAYQAFLILYAGYVALPVLAGADKFFHLLVNWDQYLAPRIAELLPVSGHTFMLGVGVIEIAAGLLVALWPRIGGWVVALWLWGIILNLLLVPGFYDIALRDFGLSLGALALARQAREFQGRPAFISLHSRPGE